MDIAANTADELKRILDEQPGGMLEVGLGVEAEIGITGTPRRSSRLQKSTIFPIFLRISYIFKAIIS